MQDIVYVNTKCTDCGEAGASPTFKQILENEESVLFQSIEKQGYVSILCSECTNKKELAL